jgi:hypothetical protein
MKCEKRKRQRSERSFVAFVKAYTCHTLIHMHRFAACVCNRETGAFVMMNIPVRHDRTRGPGRNPGIFCYARRSVSLFYYERPHAQGQAAIILVTHTLAHASHLLSAWRIPHPRSRLTPPQCLTCPTTSLAPNTTSIPARRLPQPDGWLRRRPPPLLHLVRRAPLHSQGKARALGKISCNDSLQG